MSARRPVTCTRVNWGDNGEGAKVRNGMCPGEKLKEKESSQSLTDQGKAKLVKQASVDRMAANASITKIIYEEEDVSSRKKQGATRPPRHTSSKYDFVKVRVWLGDNSDHYYVLSRFLVSRMLTVTKIPNHVAIKIALELKKLLIDNSLLDVSQSDLEANLFKFSLIAKMPSKRSMSSWRQQSCHWRSVCFWIMLLLMERRGYGLEYINRYKMMTRFHHQRIPLVILVCGVSCAGKSTIATQLAQRLNLPNVLQTDMVYELLRTSTDAPLATTPVWARDFSSPEELITEFCRECRIVRKGLDGDLTKAMTDGKPVIIEGFHLDPSLYLLEKDNGTVTASQSDASVAPVEPDVLPVRDLEPGKDQSATVLGNSELGTSHALKALVEEQVADRKHISDVHNLLSEEKGDPETCEVNGGPKKPSATQADDSENSEETSNARETGENATSKPPIKAIVVPIVLRMAEEDHQVLLEEWIACTSGNGTVLLEEEEAFISKFRIIQDYLCSFESQGLEVVDISATTFPQTLDWLHGYLLQCIEQGCTAAVPSAGT